MLPTALVLVFFTVTRVTLRDSNVEKIFSFNEISCEEVVQWGMNNVRTCVMNGRSAINTSNVVISGPKDDKVLEVDFSGNRKIELLPALIAVKYPKLRHYSAWLCAIRKISKINFYQLTSLEWLDLSYNRIEAIDDNTFHGLTSLQKIDLCKFSLILMKIIVTSRSFIHRSQEQNHAYEWSSVLGTSSSETCFFGDECVHWREVCVTIRNQESSTDRRLPMQLSRTSKGEAENKSCEGSCLYVAQSVKKFES